MAPQNTRRFIGGGALAVAFLFLGRETVAWVLGKILDATTGLFPGEKTPK
jgi:hypothetical protein